MGAGADDDLAELIDRALDGRPRMWLARRSGVHESIITRGMKGQKPFTRRQIERILAALPPPPANGHGNGQAPAEDGGAMPGPS